MGLIRLLIFEQFVVGCGSKNGYQGLRFLKEIGLHAQNFFCNLGSIVNVIGGTDVYD